MTDQRRSTGRSETSLQNGFGRQALVVVAREKIHGAMGVAPSGGPLVERIALVQEVERNPNTMARGGLGFHAGGRNGPLLLGEVDPRPTGVQRLADTYRF